REIYKRYGFDMLAIWGKDIKDETLLLNKILEFERMR
ncbi:unnamed protein product, partial [marine sediment metagenome]